jgi:hypothetical protein
MHNTFHIEIEATPERVFYWLDDAERVMQWAKGVVENEDLVKTEAGVGSTFRQVFEENGKKMDFTGECTAYDTNKRLRVYLKSKMFDLDVDYMLEDLGGRTRLTQESDVKWNGFMKLIGPVCCLFMKKSGQKCMEDDFGRLKALAEGQPEPAAST